MRSIPALLAPLAMAGLLAACDGEKADYTTDIYDISWVFVAGDATFEEAGIYGPDALKPGARSGAVTWGDADNLWLFGGRGRDGADAFGNLNDLWRYDGTAWIHIDGSDLVGSAGVYGTQGVPHAENQPGARRDALSWTDDQGNFWLFGGFGFDESASEGWLNDLWVYQWDAEAAAGLWTWVGGAKTVNAYGVYGTQGTPDPLNWPGARSEAAGWVELETLDTDPVTTQARNLWLFGGYGNGVSPECCVLNDLWRYQPGDPVTAVGTWTWIKGSDSANAIPVYGSTGFSDPANVPGARRGMVAWRESHGGVWLYGGRGFNTTGGEVVFGELWKLVYNDVDPVNPTWDWAYVAGTQGAFAAPVYAARGVVSFNNQPGSRYRPQAWTTADDRLCLFGGEVWGSATATAPTWPADLWCFDVLAWNWLGGTTVDSPAGDYPALGGRGTPGGRAAGAGWVDALDTLWLFGGESVDAEGDLARRNDLWLIAP